MHEQDAPRGRGPDSRGFVPRLVGGGEAALARPGARGQSARPMPVSHAELDDPAVREIADSLADLFLGSPPGGAMDGVGMRGDARPAMASGRSVGASRAEADDGRSGVRGSPRPSIELIVLGHLPVLGGAWVTQYASHAATSMGRPVGLIRLDPEGITVDLLGIAKDARLERAESLREAIGSASGMVGRWLIRVDELSEATLAESPHVGTITVLSGVSQTSIVAAYRALKSIAQRSGVAGERDGDRGVERGDERAELNIALLGASPERAADASAKVRKAAGAFLGRPVGIVVCGERIGQTGARSLFRGRFEGDGARLLELIRGVDSGQTWREVQGPASRAARGRDDDMEPGAPARGMPVPTSADEDDLAWLLDGGGVIPERASDATGAPVVVDDLEPMAEPTPAAKGHAEREAEVDQPARISTRDTAGTPAVAGPIVVPPSPACLADLLHLTGLPLRCPEAPGVEIAVDAQGLLHAIALDEVSAGDGGLGVGGGGRVGVAGLLATDAWVRANFALIARAMSFVKDGAVGLHLVTRVPAASRELLGTRVRVHLLARAVAPGDVCVALN